MPVNKRAREEPEEESIEKRLVNLIVRIGDRSIADLNSHLRGLAAALTAELPTSRTLIYDTILDCVRGLQPKAPIYGALCGLLAANPQGEPDGVVAADIVAQLGRELQEALDVHATFSIRAFCRFAIELANARVASVDSALALLETLLAVTAEPGVLPARAEWFACVVLDSLALGGEVFTRDAPERSAALLGAVRAYAATRGGDALSAPALLLPYGGATRPGEVTEHFDALFALVEALSSDSYHWRSSLLLAPSRSFASELAALEPLPLPTVSVPAHTRGCTYPCLRRLRLCSEPAADGDGDAAMGDDGGGGGGGGGGLGLVDRTLMEEYAWLLVSQFEESHKDAAKLLHGLAENLAIDACEPLVETLLSMLLLLPAPRHRQTYYACLLLDISRLLTPAPRMLVRAVNTLYASLDRLDAELAIRLADWLSFHISHFGFNLEPFEASWAPRLSAGGAAGAADAADAADDAAAAGSPRAELPHDAFVRHILDKCLRLAYLERLQKGLPAPFVSHLPPQPAGAAAWGAVDPSAVAEPGSMQAKSVSLLNRLRSRAEQADVLDWLQREVPPAELQTLVVHSLLDAGAKSVSHLERLLDKFNWLVAAAAQDGPARARVVGAVAAYWRTSPHMTWLVLSKLVRRELVDPQALVGWLCSAPERRRLAWPSTWEGLHLLFERSLSHFKSVEGELKAEEDKYAEYVEMIGGEEEGSTSAAGQRLETKRAISERARREKKELFANFFAGVCGAFDDHAKAAAAAGAPVETAWWSAAIGHAVGLCRRHIAEYSLSSVEAVVEVDELAAAVQRSVFERLREVSAWQL